MDSPLDRRLFLNMAALFEAGLALLALILGWLFGIEPLKQLNWNWQALLFGLVAVPPMIIFFLSALWIPLPEFRRIRQLLLATLGPPLSECRWHELLLLAGIVGFCEELLFRGFLQPALERFGYWPALLGCNVLFGLAHFVSLTYALFTFLAGCVLSWLLDAGGSRELLSPMVAHTVYDYVAFLVVVTLFRRETRH